MCHCRFLPMLPKMCRKISAGADPMGGHFDAKMHLGTPPEFHDFFDVPKIAPDPILRPKWLPKMTPFRGFLGKVSALGAQKRIRRKPQYLRCGLLLGPPRWHQKGTHFRIPAHLKKGMENGTMFF